MGKIDPSRAWQPWQPTAGDPWGRKWAAHLYRRAAFGASREELVEAERLGLQGTLDLLIRGRPHAGEMLETILDVGKLAAARDDAGRQLRGWWLYCMLHSGHPLREKMTLFWHNHFATSMAKVQNPMLMFRQNCLLREHALGKFEPFLQAMSKDGAMLIWLDSNSNIAGKPNENYAREVMELFSLGVGNYTEKDIREAARAFTGWHTTGESFVFQARMHDNAAKTVLGKTGNWNGDDVVRIVLAQPAAARFLVRKLYQYLISEQGDPSDALLEPLVVAFRKSNYDIAALLRTMLSSRLFYSEQAFRQRVKSPVEYVLGAVQAVYGRFPEGDPDYRALPQHVLVNWLGAMGQQLFAPPNVKGWPGARTWLNTSTVLERDNFAAALSMGTLWSSPAAGPTAPVALPELLTKEALSRSNHSTLPGDLPEEADPPRAFDPARLLREEGVSRPEDVVRMIVDLYLPGGIHPMAKEKLVTFLADGRPTGPALDRRVREVVHAIMTTAEYQLA